MVADGHRMTITPMASPARHRLISRREDGGAGEIRIDLPHQENHPARDFLARVLVGFKWLAAAVAITTIHVESVPLVARIFRFWRRAQEPSAGRKRGPERNTTKEKHD